jgi:hypothetical protein
MKGFSVVIARNILFIGGIVIAISFAVFMFVIFIPSIVYGSCWAGARTELRDMGREIEGAIRSPSSPPLFYRLDMGNCIAGVVFINGREDPAYSKIISEECSEYSGYKSYMITIPSEFLLVQKDKDLEDELGKSLDDLKSTLSAWDIIKLYMKKKIKTVPSTYCKEFEHEFSVSGINSIPEDFPKSFNTGTEPYCFEISPVPTSGGDFNYQIKKVPCPAEKKDEGQDKK